jgi:hypothetical protein
MHADLAVGVIDKTGRTWRQNGMGDKWQNKLFANVAVKLMCSASVLFPRLLHFFTGMLLHIFT